MKKMKLFYVGNSVEEKKVFVDSLNTFSTDETVGEIIGTDFLLENVCIVYYLEKGEFDV